MAPRVERASLSMALSLSMSWWAGEQQRRRDPAQQHAPARARTRRQSRPLHSSRELAQAFVVSRLG